MDSRREELNELEKYLNEVDKEITMILQNLQWDRDHMKQSNQMSTCKFDVNHKIPSNKVEKHKEVCFLKSQGYSVDDRLLPAPLDLNMNTLVKLDYHKIQQIISDASQQDPLFKKGRGYVGPPPLTLERLQASYSADERRAIHDAVVSAVPSCHDLSELALLSSGRGRGRGKSRAEVLAELRDMKRRRARYRGAARAPDYSASLRAVIATQMALYGDTLQQTGIKKEPTGAVAAKEQDCVTTCTLDTSVATDNTTDAKETRLSRDRDENHKERKKYDDKKSETQSNTSDTRLKETTKYERYDQKCQKSEGSLVKDDCNKRTSYASTKSYSNRDDIKSSSRRKERDDSYMRIKDKAMDSFSREDKESSRRKKTDRSTHRKKETTDICYKTDDRDSYSSRRKERDVTRTKYETVNKSNRDSSTTQHRSRETRKTYQRKDRVRARSRHDTRKSLYDEKQKHLRKRQYDRYERDKNKNRRSASRDYCDRPRLKYREH